MAEERYGSLTVVYDSDNVSPSVAKDIVEIAFEKSVSYPKDGFYNIAYPRETFYLTKYNDEIGYNITFRGYGHVPDPYLEYTKSLYNELKDRKYRVSIVFLKSNGDITFEYSDSNYRIELLKNNLFVLLLLPVALVLTMMFCRFISGWVESNVDSPLLFNLCQEVIPFVFYPVSVLAFKLSPSITIMNVVKWAIIMLTVLSYYLCVGYGLKGSLVLLVIFILKSIQDSIS